jgi:hypothetical protein
MFLLPHLEWVNTLASAAPICFLTVGEAHMVTNRKSLILLLIAVLGVASIVLRVTLHADQTCYIQPPSNDGLTANVRVGSSGGFNIVIEAIFYGPGSDYDIQTYYAAPGSQSGVGLFQHTFPEAGTYYFSATCDSDSGSGFADTYLTVP